MKQFLQHHRFQLITVFLMFVMASIGTQTASAYTYNSFRANNDILYYDDDFKAGICTASNPATPGTADFSNVPDPWRSLILDIAGLYPTADPRLVAATLWIENRGWPDYNKDWGVSSASAAGPWQFIPSTWALMGTDGDNDGVKDPNNPKDAVHAAYKHQKDSMGKPLIDGFTGDIDAGLSLIFQRDRQNLLSFMASYNGRGAPDGVALKDFPRGENADYVMMAYYLLASNFTKSWSTASGQVMDISGTSAAQSAIAQQKFGTDNCNNAKAPVTTDGYAFPIGGIPKNQISNGYRWPCPTICHHDKTHAMDLFHVENSSDTSKDNLSVGLPVYAITKGKIQSLGVYKNISGCYAFQFLSDDGWYYWYGHIRNVSAQEGQSVEPGTKIAEIGERKCTGNDSVPHLHIDRGYPKGHIGGIDAYRDPSFTELMNGLYERLP